MSAADIPEPDRVDGAPHPRQTPHLFGHAAAEAVFLDAFAAGRLHHGWLIAGPRGVGKATLAWRIARFLLATPDSGGAGGLFAEAPAKPGTLDIAPDHPVARRMAALSEPRLHLVRRGGLGSTETEREKSVLAGRFSKQIRVDEVRDLARFVNLSAADGGRRAVIIDAADEMNAQAANALLKMLEEPPARTTLLLVSHQPARLLPTIRSRCRDLRLGPLAPDDMAAALGQAGVDAGPDVMALAELSGGSAGEAIRLINLDGLKIYAEIAALARSLPKLDRPRAIRLAEAAAARGAEDRLDLLVALFDRLLARLARTGASGVIPPEAAPGEAELLARLAPTPTAGRAWAECAQQIGARAQHGRSVNLDPAALVLDTVFRLQQTAGG